MITNVKKLFTVIEKFLLVAFVSTTASAYPIVFEDTYTIDQLLIADGGAYSYAMNINNVGFNPESDLLLTAEITMYLQDDQDRDTQFKVRKRFKNYVPGGWRTRAWGYYTLFPGEEEFVEITLDGETSFGYEVDYTNITTSINEKWLDDGMLNITVKSTSGDFYFAGSKLTVSGERSTTVPEPSILLLLALGVFAMFCNAKLNIRGWRLDHLRR